MLQHHTMDNRDDTNTKQIESSGDTPDLRLLIVRAGNKLFGVDMAAVAHTGDETCDFAAPQPTPLPGAPVPVRGVVYVRGQLYTVIDLTQMFATHKGEVMQETGTTATTLRVVPLRGKEQLALAVEGVEEIISINESNIESLDEAIAATRGIVRGVAEEDILVLDVGKLFAAATQGMERRRRRS